MTWLFFLLSLASAALTYNVRHPISRGYRARVFGFFAGWLWGELAPHIVALHAVLIVVFAVSGALSGTLGILGLLVMAASCGVLLNIYLDSAAAAGTLDRALKEALGDDYEERVDPEPRAQFEHKVRWRPLLRPFKFGNPDVEPIRGIRFARDKGIDLKLDILRPRSVPEKAPVLLQIHGGAWTIAYKENQGLPLMWRLASRGWICVNIDYRLSPHATFPDHLIDCKRAIAWIRENIARYGGDPDFIVATGDSAGGHLCELVGLTANDPEYQPGFEDVDTTVRACVPFYGVSDLANRHGFHTASGLPILLEETVMKGSYDEQPEAYHRASPVDRVGEQAPAFFIIHGNCDSLVPVEDSRIFSELLREKSKQPVAYAELDGAQHAFDAFHCARSQAAVDAVERFSQYIHCEYLRTASKPKPKPKAKGKKVAKAASGKAAAATAKSKTPAKAAGAKRASTGEDRVARLPASKAEAKRPRAAAASATKAASPRNKVGKAAAAAKPAKRTAKPAKPTTKAAKRTTKAAKRTPKKK